MAFQVKKRSKTAKINTGEYPYIDLMPESRRKAVMSKKAFELWSKRVFASAILMAILSGVAFGYKLYNQSTLDGKEKAKANVESLILANADIDQALTIKQQISENIKRGIANSIDWEAFHSRLSNNLPSNSWLGSMSVVTGGILENGHAIGVQVSILSAEPIDYANMFQSLSEAPGLMTESLTIGNMTGRDSANGFVYQYPVAFNVDVSILKWLNAESQDPKSFGIKKDNPKAVPVKTEEVSEEAETEEENNGSGNSFINNAENAVDDLNELTENSEEAAQ